MIGCFVQIREALSSDWQTIKWCTKYDEWWMIYFHYIAQVFCWYFSYIFNVFPTFIPYICPYVSINYNVFIKITTVYAQSTTVFILKVTVFSIHIPVFAVNILLFLVNTSACYLFYAFWSFMISFNPLQCNALWIISPIWPAFTYFE